MYGKPVVCNGLRDGEGFVHECTIYEPEMNEWKFLANTTGKHTYAAGIQLDEGSFWITGT